MYGIDVCARDCCAAQLLEDMLTMFDLIQLWQVDSHCVELEQIGLRMLLAFCANGVLDVRPLFFELRLLMSYYKVSVLIGDMSP